MTKHLHPMRKAVFHAYVREDGEEVIVRAKPYGLCPMLFEGSTVAETLAKAEAFRAETVAQNEATYAKRQEALAKARLARKAKAVTVGEE